jgi:hypothetical protein
MKSNKDLMELYWNIGKLIVEMQKSGHRKNLRNNYYGKSIVAELSKDLQREFPGVRGLSDQNLWRMRKLYMGFRGSNILPSLMRECLWTHNIIILEKCCQQEEREFYLRMTARNEWSTRKLVKKIKAQTFWYWYYSQESH